MRNQTSFRLTTTLLPTDTTAKVTQVINKVDSEGEKFYPTFTEETVVLTNDDRTIMETTRATCSNGVLTFTKRGLSDDNTETQVENRKLTWNPGTLCFITAGAGDWIDKDDDIEWTGKQTYTGELVSTNKATYKGQLITEKGVKYPSFETVEDLNSYADPFGGMFATVDSTGELYRYNAVTEQWDLVSTVALGTYEIRVSDEKPEEGTEETIVTLSPEQQGVYVGTRTIIEKPKMADVLVVGGGGGGGKGVLSYCMAGGGGAGGVALCQRYLIVDPLVCVKVGGGGAGATEDLGSGLKGGGSQFDKIKVCGGGSGAGPGLIGGSGANGGGGSTCLSNLTNGGTGYDNVLYGHQGGNGVCSGTCIRHSGQGGSAIKNGECGRATVPGASVIIGSKLVTVSAGGGGQTYSSGSYTPQPNTENYCGSGGGAGISCCNGGDGKCGVVMVAYPKDGSYGYCVASGGCKLLSGDYIIHCFTSNGTFIPGVSENKFHYTIVGGGGGGGGGGSVYGGTTLSTRGGSGGGGGGQVVAGTMNNVTTTSYNIVVGCGGAGGVGAAGVPATGCNGGTSCLGTLCANGGCGGGEKGGASGSGCVGGNFCIAINCGSGGGGGGSSGNGVNSTCYLEGGNGGLGMFGYGGGGGGGVATTTSTCRGCGCSGGGDGGTMSSGCNATGCGGGGGGGSSCISSSKYRNGGNGACGVVEICYKTIVDGILCATGGAVTTSGEYTVHTFTSDGTFCILCTA